VVSRSSSIKRHDKSEAPRRLAPHEIGALVLQDVRLRIVGGGLPPIKRQAAADAATYTERSPASRLPHELAK